jgi:hypothetical protein
LLVPNKEFGKIEITCCKESVWNEVFINTHRQVPINSIDINLDSEFSIVASKFWPKHLELLPEKNFGSPKKVSARFSLTISPLNH